jgi:hypothetical protein
VDERKPLEPGHRYPVRIEYTPAHESGSFTFSMKVDGTQAASAGDLQYFYITQPSPPPPAR